MVELCTKRPSALIFCTIPLSASCIKLLIFERIRQEKENVLEKNLKEEIYLDVHVNKIGDILSETAVGINGAGDGDTTLDDAIGCTHTVIVLSKSGGTVYNSCTALSCDVGICNHHEGSVCLFLFIVNN